MEIALWTLLLQSFFRLSLSQNIIPILPISFPESNNTQCRLDSLLLEEGFQENLLWAMKMYDASVKLPVGFISGTTLQFGDFDECMSITEPIRSQFCLVTLVLQIDPVFNRTDPYTIDYCPYDSVWEVINDRGVDTKQIKNIVHISLCLPESCDKSVLEFELNKFLAGQNLSTPIFATLLPDSCTSHEEIPMETMDFMFCSLSALFLVLVAIGTLYDMESSNSKNGNFLLSFSLKKSYNSLMTPYPLINGLDLNRISGLYLLSALVVTLGHRLAMYMLGSMINYDFIEEMFRVSKYSLWTSNLSIVVDCFFVLGGFLVGMMAPKQVTKIRTNLFIVLFNRYLRLMPIFGLATFYHATILKFTGDGPIWKTGMTEEIVNCQENWWTNLLFINNYINTSKSCLLHAWYLPCEFHIFAVVYAIFHFTRGKPKALLPLMVALIITSSIAHFYGVYHWNLPAFLLYYKRMLDDTRNNFYYQFYIKTHFRAIPYLIGCFAGYLTYLKKPSTLSKAITYLLMTMGFSSLSLTLYAAKFFVEPGNRHLGLYSALYSTASRVVWAVGFLMIIAVLLIGADNPLKKLFSSRIFVPFGKLSYSIYILHLIVQMRSALTKRTPSYLTIDDWVARTIADMVYAAVLGLVLFFLVENPIRTLTKHYTHKKVC